MNARSILERERTMDIRSILERERQLNLLAYFVILSLAVVVGLLVFVLLSGVRIPDALPITDFVVRTLIGALLIGVLAYLFDQHRRLRAKLVSAHEQLEAARADVQASYDRLAFAHYAATVMTSLNKDDGLPVVLRQACDQFHSDAAAVVGDEVVTITADGVDPVASQSYVFQVALEAVRAGKPLTVSSGEGAGEAIAVPLRIGGRLQAVVCLWRHEGKYTDDQLDGLGLLGRIIELSMENRQLLGQVNQQLEGTIEALSSLVDDIRPDYTAHALSVAELSERIADQMGLSPSYKRDVRIAGLLHDVGLLKIGHISDPSEPLTPEDRLRVHEHPTKGAELARMASFSPEVQAAVATHHERLDGSGYPRGLSGSAQPVAGRILAVAEVYDSMSRPGPAGSPARPEAAFREVTSNGGVRYDPRVVKALTSVLAQDRAAAEAVGEPVRTRPSGGSPSPARRELAPETVDDILAAAFGKDTAARHTARRPAM